MSIDNNDGKAEADRLAGIRKRVVAEWRKVSEKNNLRPGTKLGDTAEFAFLKGAMAVEPALESDSLLGLCMLSGRSVLSVHAEGEETGG